MILNSSHPVGLRGLFRYHLWSLRDEIFDRVVDGEVNPDEGLAFVRRHESAIQNARDLTPAHLVAVNVALRAVSWLRSTPNYTDERVANVSDRFNSVLHHHLVAGSPSGWVVVPFFYLWAVAHVLSQMFLPRRNWPDTEHRIWHRVGDAAEAVVGKQQSERILESV